MVCEYEYDDEENKLKVDCSGCIYGSSIADYKECMSRTIDKLLEVRGVETVVFSNDREYEYPYEQTKLLVEIADVIEAIMKGDGLRKLESMSVPGCDQYFQEKYSEIQDLAMNSLRKDPVGAYLQLKREIRHLNIKIKNATTGRVECYEAYLNEVLVPIKELIEDTELLSQVKGSLSGYHPGDREIYRDIFHPSVRPNFMRTKYMSQPPEGGEVVEHYTKDGINVEIYDIPNEVRPVYHVIPPEFKLGEDEYTILDVSRRYMSEHQPEATEFSEERRAREVFSSIGKDLITDLARERNVELAADEHDKLTSILTRYTAGLGILEILLADDDVQDIYVNSPVGQKPVYIYHEKYGECKTNLIPTQEDAEAWATRFRLQSGRPLDEANPVLDTSVEVEGGRARVTVITRTLSPEGLGFAIRRHRRDPWTYPLYLQPDINFFNPLFAGFMSFLIDGGRTFLIGGGRSSGKTSLLGASMLEMMKSWRILTTEDSVAPDSRLIIKRNGNVEKTTAGQLVDGLVESSSSKRMDGRDIVRDVDISEDIEVYSIDEKGKAGFKPVSSFIRHRTDKDLYEVETATGRKLKVTGDHSLFSIGEKSVLNEARVKDLEKGDFIATPRKTETYGKEKDEINLLEHLEKLDSFFLYGKNIRNLIEDRWEEIKKIRKKLGYSGSVPSTWKRGNIIPVKVARRLEVDRDLDCKIKPPRGGHPVPSRIKLDDDFLSLLGLWIADGCYDGDGATIFSVQEKSLRKLVRRVFERLKLPVKKHSDEFSLMVHSRVLNRIFRRVLNFKGDSYTKEIPEWVFNLSKEQISSVLKGIFSGDGCVSDKEIVIPLASDELLKDLQSLLLNHGIILRRSNKRRKDRTFNASVSTIKSWRRFREEIGIIPEKKTERLEELCGKESTHDISDIIPLSSKVKKEIDQVYPKFNRRDYITRENNVGREKLKEIKSKAPQLPNPLNHLADSDIYWDRVVSIQKRENSGYVYDLSVPGNENFVSENILAHNTLELPVERLRELDYDVERLKSRSVITQVETELPAPEAIRTALRLGDSALIIGEVRSSLRGDQEVVVVEDGLTKRVPIKEVENMNTSNLEVPTMNGENRFELEELTDFVKHPKREELVKVVTKTGREVTVTDDHSVFTVDDRFEVKEIETNELEEGDPLVIPATMPSGYNDIESLDLIKLLDSVQVAGYDEPLRAAIDELGYKRAGEIADVPEDNDIYLHLREGRQRSRPTTETFRKITDEADIDYNPGKLRVKKEASKTLPAKLSVNKDFCRFLGYYVSEGYISNDKQAVVVHNSNEEILKDVENISQELFGVEPHRRGKTGRKGESVELKIQCPPLAHLLLELGCGRTSGEKRVPQILYGLSDEKICSFLRGVYSGDGSFQPTDDSGNRIAYFTTSKDLANDILYLLLTQEIVGRIYERGGEGRREDLFTVEFKQREFVRRFLERAGFVKYETEMIEKSFPHTPENSVPIDPEYLDSIVDLPRKYRHLRKEGRCGKNYLKQVAEETGNEKLQRFAGGDFYLDRVKRIERVELEEPEHVYDLSVNPTENFVGGFGGILLHNTEAKALYEAMRIGAMAKSVAGTIHGESAYGLYDRVVNDLGVPSTSFKATDIIVICNRIKSASGLGEVRRVTNVTEVRKHWQEDPMDEDGFVPLMEYSAEEDELKPTDTLLNGESEILNRISSQVKEWAGRWDRVWENIQLRGKVKKKITDYALETGRHELMEAPFVVKSNEKFRLIMDELVEEFGYVPKDEAYERWENWIKEEIKGS